MEAGSGIPGRGEGREKDNPRSCPRCSRASVWEVCELSQIWGQPVQVHMQERAARCTFPLLHAAMWWQSPTCDLCAELHPSFIFRDLGWGRLAARQLPGLRTVPHRMCVHRSSARCYAWAVTKDLLEGTQGGGRACKVPGGPKRWGQGLSSTGTASPLQK